MVAEVFDRPLTRTHDWNRLIRTSEIPGLRSTQALPLGAVRLGWDRFLHPYALRQGFGGLAGLLNLGLEFAKVELHSTDLHRFKQRREPRQGPGENRHEHERYKLLIEGLCAVILDCSKPQAQNGKQSCAHLLLGKH